MIPYGKQSINNEDVLAVSNALKSDWLTIGPLVEIFEKEIAKIVGAPIYVIMIPRMVSGDCATKPPALS